MKKSFMLLLIILSFTTMAANGDQYKLKLLAVQENGEEYAGSEADLYLELKEGSGRVFLETFPLTKFDTQISTRFAKDIACNHFHLSCEQYDFIYTIKAKTNIIGGPSAGAAIAALTTIAVLDLDYDSSVAITGTINSGGVIGPVGGVKAKLEAAAQSGLRKVLIPKGASFSHNRNRSNSSDTELNLIDYSRDNLSLEAVEVIDLDQVLVHLTAKNLNTQPVDLTENTAYTTIMQSLQQVLCERTKKIQSEIDTADILLNNETLASVTRRNGQAFNATKLNDFYSAASFCFGNNIELKTAYYTEKKPNLGIISKLFKNLELKTQGLQEKVAEEEINTISDLQAVMIVKERLNDVHDQIQSFTRDQNQSTIEDSYRLLAYAEERFFSAVSWMQFFNMQGKKFVFNEERLENSCQQKIIESEERHQYASLFVGPNNIAHIQEKIATAKKALHEAEFTLCLITATQAKAEADAILGSLGLRDETIDEFIESKRRAVERIIAENSAEGIFPILGYSYYQYANSLKTTEKSTALVYLEYALEMSDLGIYFPAEKSGPSPVSISKEIQYLIIGILVGMALMFFIMKKR